MGVYWPRMVATPSIIRIPWRGDTFCPPHALLRMQYTSPPFPNRSAPVNAHQSLY